MKRKHSNVFLRIMTALVTLPVVIGLICWGIWGYFILFLIVLIGTLLEYYKLLYKTSITPLSGWGILFSALLYTGSFLYMQGSIGATYGWLAMLLFLSSYFIVLYKKKDPLPFTTLAHTFLGIIYIALPFAMLHRIALYDTTYHAGLVLGLLLMIWANDIGAYCVGYWLGKHPLFKRLSPKKTWEGALGGILSTLLTSQIIAGCQTIWPSQVWFIVGLLTALGGVYGDLLESLLKRSLQIKDSGVILPGHGGFLDRFDSFLLAVPFVITFIELYKLTF